jgi:hypothetical protein
VANYLILPTTKAHLGVLAEKLRAGDAAEIEAAGISPRRALWRSWRNSVLASTMVVDGEIAAVGGVGGCPLGRVGELWLLTAPPIERAKIAFLAEARSAVRVMLTIFPELRGRVSADYHKAVRLLEVLGFTVGEPFAFGPSRTLFREYRMVRH